MVGEHPGGGGAHRTHRVERGVDDLAELGGVPGGRQVLEVEGLVHLVGAHVVGGALDGRGPRLGDEDTVAGVLVEDGAPAAVDLVHTVLVEERHDIVAQQFQLVVRAEVGQTLRLDEAVGDVDAEAVDAHVEPEAQDRAELVRDGGVFPVEVGLLRREEVQVPLAGGAVRVRGPRPGGAAEDGLPVVGREFAVGALAGAEVVALAQGGAGALGEGALEPLVLVGGVVGHQVDDDAQVQTVGLADQRVGVEERAEHRVDGPVVGDVVTRVGLRRGVEGAEPHGVHTEVPQVREPRGDTREVPHAVAVAVGEAAWVHLVDHRVLPPAGAVARGVVGRAGGGGSEVLGHVVPGVSGGERRRDRVGVPAPP